MSSRAPLCRFRLEDSAEDAERARSWWKLPEGLVWLEVSTLPFGLHSIFQDRRSRTVERHGVINARCSDHSLQFERGSSCRPTLANETNASPASPLPLIFGIDCSTDISLQLLARLGLHLDQAKRHLNILQNALDVAALSRSIGLHALFSGQVKSVSGNSHWCSRKASMVGVVQVLPHVVVKRRLAGHLRLGRQGAADDLVQELRDIGGLTVW
ncbi:uncharacterized protein BKA78DRAFT_88120 [Phyllosticta capitalensis]|uniref:uncharacterized protein n=1 Tax=Phyllosticta capitalensis TaxID=121624 RepID=UPI0031317B39